MNEGCELVVCFAHKARRASRVRRLQRCAVGCANHVCVTWRSLGIQMFTRRRNLILAGRPQRHRSRRPDVTVVLSSSPAVARRRCAIGQCRLRARTTSDAPVHEVEADLSEPHKQRTSSANWIAAVAKSARVKLQRSIVQGDNRGALPSTCLGPHTEVRAALSSVTEMCQICRASWVSPLFRRIS